MLIVLAGLPASGKSALGIELQRELDAVLLDKDSVRKFLFSDYVDYSRRQNDLCANVLYDVATYLLSKPDPPVVILDGRTYSKTYQVHAVKQAADQTQSKLYFLECICSEHTAQERLDQDAGIHLAEDRNFDMYLKSKAEAEIINEAKLVIDTDRYSPGQACALALQYLRS